MDATNDVVKSQDKIKQRVISLAFAFLVCGSLILPFFFEQSWDKVVIFGTCCIMVCIVLLFWKGRVRKSKYNASLIILIIIIGISFIINGCIFGTLAYFAIGGIWAVILPVFYLVANGEHNVNIDMAISNGVIITFFVFFCLSLIIGEDLDIKQYCSFLGNPNSLGDFMIVVVAASLYKICVKEKKLDKFKYGVVLGIAMAMVFFSQSRAAMLATGCEVLICACLYIVVVINGSLDYKIKKTMKIVMSAIIIFVVSVVFVYIMFTFVKVELTKLIDTTTIQKMKIHTLNEWLGATKKRAEKGIGKNGINADAFTSGRIGIWKDYSSNIELIGHKEEERNLVSGDRIYKRTNAHNVYLQMAYSAGIIAGFSMFALVLLIAKENLSSIYLILRRRLGLSDYIFPICCCIGFAFPSMTSSGYMIFTYISATLFWLGIYKFMMKRDKNV